jgi:transcriptional regulator with XRE-family HTH domain
VALDMTSVIGERLRAERESRGWPRLTLAKKLRDAADYPGDVPTTDGLLHNIYRWERGKDVPSERYQFLYCRVFSLTRQQLFGGNRDHTNAAVRIAESELSAEPVMLADGRIGFMFPALPSGLDRIEFQIFGTITMSAGPDQDNAGESTLVLVKSNQQASHEEKQATSRRKPRRLSNADSAGYGTRP